MKKHYVQAVLEMIRTGQNPEAVLSGLSRVLVAKGHQSLKASVLAGVLRILSAQSKRDETNVTVASAADADKYRVAIEAVLTAMNADKDFVVREDPTIIGGFVAQVKNTVHDASYKSALVKLYRSIAK